MKQLLFLVMATFFCFAAVAEPPPPNQLQKARNTTGFLIQSDVALLCWNLNYGELGALFDSLLEIGDIRALVVKYEGHVFAVIRSGLVAEKTPSRANVLVNDSDSGKFRKYELALNAMVNAQTLVKDVQPLEHEGTPLGELWIYFENSGL